MRDARLTTRVDRLAEGDVTVILEPLEFIKIIDRYEHRCGLPVLRQHNTFMAAPGTVDQFGEMTAGLRNRTRERHSSTVQLDADGCRYGAPTAAAPRRGRSGDASRPSRYRLRASQELPLPPAAVTLGWELVAIDQEEGTIEVAFTAGGAFLNPAGVVQGGFLAAMLDDTMGPALVCGLEPGDFAPTTDLHVQFLRPAGAGRLVGRGRVVRRGRDVAFLAGELVDGDGAVVAVATATAQIRGGMLGRPVTRD